MTKAPPPTEMKRALSFHEVRECEFAEKPECTCRCQGRYHGAARLPTDSDEETFRKLPSDDPHHLLTKVESKAAAKRRAYIRRVHGSTWSGHASPASQFIETIRTYAYNPATGRNEVMEFPCPLCIDEGRDPKPEDREEEPA